MSNEYTNYALQEEEEDLEQNEEQDQDQEQEQEQEQGQNELQNEINNSENLKENKQYPKQKNEINDIEDILMKSSQMYENQNLDSQIRVSQTVQQSLNKENSNSSQVQIIPSIHLPNNPNENINIYNTYPISSPNNNISPSILSQYENNIFPSVQQDNPYNITSQSINEYNNNINENFSYQPQEYNINNYNVTDEQIINQFPQYDQYNQNLAISSPIQGIPTTYTNYRIEPENLIYPSYNQKYIDNFQNHAEVIHIDNERMKDPEVKKNVEESQKHINNYLSKLSNYSKKSNNVNVDNNNSFNNSKSFDYKKNLKFGKNFNNKNVNMDKENENSNSLKGSNVFNRNKKYNINQGNYLNPKKLEDFKNFSPEFYKHFYHNDDPFFQPIQDEDIIHDQFIKNDIENLTYQGDINSKNQKHGFGALVTPEKKRIGTWRNDIFNGWGREINKNGEIYEGRFEDDSLNGMGIYKYGGILYIGEFKNYKKYGKGELFTNLYHYVGDFVNNNMEGEGRIEYYNEGIYEGTFRNDEMDGFGYYKYKNGDFYEGQMKNGRMNGKGILTKRNGNVNEGIFINGEYKRNQNTNYL